MSIRVVMFPELKAFRTEESGIKRVVEAYTRYLPNYDVECVPPEAPCDLVISHAGTYDMPNICCTHGLYWTADYHAAAWEWHTNKDVVNAIRHARFVTVPSRWVQETFQRDMRFSPTIVPHGIEWEEWQESADNVGYVLWNKNRTSDACNPEPVGQLAQRFQKTIFATTFAPRNPSPNIQVIGPQTHAGMKKVVKSAGVYLSTTKETFGIGTLEALAAGVPVLGFGHGGNVDLVQHGVNGYLARPGNFDDLAEGLNYCLTHRATLSDNARITAKKFKWDYAASIIADLCRKVLEPDPPTVSIIIPSYNYADKVGRAIDGAVKQTYPINRIVVVDDGSTDDGATQRVVEEYSSLDHRVVYLRQDNQGVANARNTGIGSVSTKYICCLDADDTIAPEFIRACVEELEKDRSLGIAYTGLYYIKPDGSEGLSPWPDKFDFDKQLKRQNQIPTCCVFRREAWERTGGYKQRYAPGGAGSEDAEFFTRMGAYGWGAKKVTDAGLFIYSWLSGRVSGNKDYREVDWLALHPWAKDEQHPFASVATPENKISHPVRQYDEPTISVIIPVGKGHENTVKDALDSLESQTFRKWEVIVVWDGTGGAREDVERAYPYIRSIINEAPPFGAGAARNGGAKWARAPLLLFLDADDWLYPEALAKMLHAFRAEQAIIYPDYTGKSFMSYADATKLGDRLLYYSEKTGEAVISYRSFDYDYDRAVAQPRTDGSIYIWNLVSSLVPRAWHNEIGGFDEKMPSWEDWDYWLRMARAGKCFVRIPEQLVVYRFYTGSRRETGIQENQSLLQYLQRKFEGIEIMPCNCGKNRKTPLPTLPQIVSRVSRAMEESVMKDDDIVLIEYTSLNRGQHKVVGGSTGRFLGQRAGGDKFYVPLADAKARPDLFRIIEETKVEIAEPKRETPAPMPVQEPPAYVESVTVSEAVEKLKALMTPVTVTDTSVLSDKFDLELVPGVTPGIARDLAELGVDSYEDILEMGEEGLIRVKNVGKGRAAAIHSYAKEQVYAKEREQQTS